MQAKALLPSLLRRWVRARILECELPRCRRFSFLHPWRRSHAGILLETRWYCSPECLGDALYPRLCERARPAERLPRPPIRLPLRLVLLDRDIVTSAQLEQARADRDATQPAEDFGDTLLRLGYATDAQIASARAREAGFPVYSGPAKVIPPACLLPDVLMRAFAAVPVCHVPAKAGPGASSGRLFLGFVYQVNHPLVRAAEEITGCLVQPCLIPRSLYQSQLSRLQRAQLPEEIALSVPTLPEMRAEIIRQSIRRHAELVCLGRVGPLLWVRLAGGLRNADLLFDLAEVAIGPQAQVAIGAAKGGREQA